ncbi:hypothetical protein GCM10020221_23340 [Streptomyces thioluteus]|uniref:DUF5753 domain-containing protein n=1 Tax=Streptomyces thioluteus TaxID=66431 RepID=A0ABN3WV82_STRTU
MLASVRPDNLDELVAARVTRQDILEREAPPRTWFVMDEYALMRRIGGPRCHACTVRSAASGRADAHAQ